MIAGVIATQMLRNKRTNGEPKEKEAVATQVFYVRLAHLLREFDDDMCTLCKECQGREARNEAPIYHCIVVGSLPAPYRVEASNE